MSRLTRSLTAPLRLATNARRARSDRWPSLPRPAVSVGNLALGGRGKTPLVAALTDHAVAAGARPAVLLRGYPRVGRRAAAHVLVRKGPAATPWTALLDRDAVAAQSFTHAPLSGEEAAWLAAVTGVPVGVHPDRTQAAAAVLRAHPEVDLFLLDDGLQAAVQPDVELVLVDPERDLRESPRPAATRETEGGLPPNAKILRLGIDVERRPGILRDLEGAVVDPSGLDPVTVCAAVGDPASVEVLAQAVGLRVERRLRVRDHGAPSAQRLASVRGPLLVTEKDAVGWAAARAPSGCVVLGMTTTGSKAIWESIWPLPARVL